MNTAIIVAAGTGTRFGSDMPKQFLEVLGKPVIVHTLEKFEKCDVIDEIVLVLSDAGRREFEISNFKSEISKLRLIVIGGETRAGSVKLGFDAVDAGCDIVVVHDGARPLVSLDEITRTVEKAAEIGAACLVAELTDTIKTVKNGLITGTLDRAGLRRALTPQAFQYDILAKAFARTDLSREATDECFLVERLDVEIAVVEGNSRNIKITRPEDLLIAESLMKNG